MKLKMKHYLKQATYDSPYMLEPDPKLLIINYKEAEPSQKTKTTISSGAVPEFVLILVHH